jgi:hypothetical protein
MTNNSAYFNGRHVIGPDTEILGGVLFGSGAIVVDHEDNPAPYEEGYAMVDNLLARSADPSLLEVAFAVNNVVRKMVPFSDPNKEGTPDIRDILRSEAEARGLARISREDEVPLSLFVGDAGVCHHQTLFGGVLLRLLQQRRDLKGRVSVDLAPPDLATEPERHVWLRYIRGKERVIIDSSSTPPVLKLERPVRILDRLYVRPEEMSKFVPDEELTEDDMLRVIRSGLGRQYPFLEEGLGFAS